jgi:hypothetical protein
MNSNRRKSKKEIMFVACDVMGSHHLGMVISTYPVCWSLDFRHCRRWWNTVMNKIDIVSVLIKLTDLFYSAVIYYPIVLFHCFQSGFRFK